MTTIQPAEFLDELKADSATDRWDVMVSYSEKQLNDLLAVRWKRSMKPMPLHFEVNTPIDETSHLNQTFDIELGAPSLQFATTRGKATLSFPLEGGWKSKIVTEGEDDIVRKPVSIMQKSYAVDVSVPIVHMFANESTKPPEASAPEGGPPKDNSEETVRTIIGDGTEIHFEDDKLGSTFITFEFDNEKIDAEIRNTTGKALSQDSVMLKTKDNVVNALITYMLDKEHVQWIKYSIAVVTNKTDPGDKWSDLLRPSSCMFSTQPGALNVFIKTKGGSAGSGISPPSFRHLSTKDILPFPTGYEASIIISRHLFLEDFLLPNLKTMCKDLKSDRPIDASKPASGTGLALNLRLEESKTFNYQKIYQGWSYDKLTVDDFTTDFDTNPVTVTIDKGSDGITPESKWHWTFSSNINWRRDIVTVPGRQGQHEIYVGKAKLDTTMPNTSRQFATISGDSLDISLAFRDPTDQPSISFTAEDREASKWKGEVAKKEIPKELYELNVKLTPFEMSFPKLDFFATQNVFAPGTRFMTATQVMFPHDVVLTGKMARVDDKPSAFFLSESIKNTSAEKMSFSFNPPADGTSLLPLLDRLYTDNRFLGTTMTIAEDRDGDAVLNWFSEQGFTFTADDAKRLNELKLPGPSFDLRFAGGAYKLKAENLAYQELFIQSVSRKVYIDGQETVSKTDGMNGKVLVTTNNGEQSLELEFVADEGVIKGFKGITWSNDAPDKTSPISGEIFFPWDSTSPKRSPRDMSPAEKQWEQEASKYYAVGLDLASPIRAPPETDDALALVDHLFTPALGMVLGSDTAPAPAPSPVPATVWKDIPGLLEWVATLPYRLFKFRQGIIKRKRNKVLDKYSDKAKLVIADEPLPEDVLDQFHQEVERSVNEALDVPKYRNEAPEKIREFIEGGLREVLVRSLMGLSRRELAEELEALKGVRDLQTKTIIDEAIKGRLEADIDRKHYEPYLDGCIESRQAELKYQDAVNDIEKFQEAIDKAKREHEENEGTIQDRKKSLEALKKEMEGRPPATDDVKRLHDLKSEIDRLLGKQKDIEGRINDSEGKKLEKEGERDQDKEEKEKVDKQVDYHKKKWLKEHEK